MGKLDRNGKIENYLWTEFTNISLNNLCPWASKATFAMVL